MQRFVHILHVCLLDTSLFEQALDREAAASTPHYQWMQHESRGHIRNGHTQWTGMEGTLQDMSM
jgi:hypothetical protein